MKISRDKGITIIGFILSMPCFILSWGMINSLSGEGSLGVLTYRDILVYPTIIISCLITMLSAVMLLMNYVHKKQGYITLLYTVLFFVSVISICNTIYFLNHYSFQYNKVICQLRLRNLSGSMGSYYFDYNAYPSADQWCDLLEQHMKSQGIDFTMKSQCPGGGKGRCHFALNPNLTPDSPTGTVWLFDSHDGWNLHGGSELMNFDNHEGKGCNVLLYRVGVKFIEKDKIDELKWDNEN